MTRWIVQEWVPYEGISEEYFDSAEAVFFYIQKISRHRHDDLTIFPEPVKTYEPLEFIQAFERGELIESACVEKTDGPED